jgi:hypothetical protein
MGRPPPSISPHRPDALFREDEVEVLVTIPNGVRARAEAA